MSGSRPPYLQRRGDAFHLRVRVPENLRDLVGVREIRRGLGTDSASAARPLAMTYSARIMRVFEMARTETLSKDRVRALVAQVFDDLRKPADRGFRPATCLPEVEIEEQRELASNRISELEDQLLLNRFDDVVGVVADIRPTWPTMRSKRCWPRRRSCCGKSPPSRTRSTG